MSDREWYAWAAGFFEGEGCWFINPSGKKYFTVRASINQKGLLGKELLEKFQQLLQVGTIYCYTRKSVNRGIWIWQTNKIGEPKKVFDLLQPWLGSRRIARFLELYKQEQESRIGQIPRKVVVK